MLYNDQPGYSNMALLHRLFSFQSNDHVISSNNRPRTFTATIGSGDVDAPN